MGEVYRARDTKLDREIAIKVLPEALTQDPERLARFRREATLLAALNHPHIASIYGLEEADGNPFLVLELIPGEDLSERIERGPIPLDEALEISRQIAEALEEAHEKGIVHRDLKPANIKLTEDGKVKVLDFGLAKAYAADETESTDVSQSPTMSARATAAGLLLGTAAYMSPEQARGKPVDKRADIWAFGVVLFEMLTGKRLFTGETVSDTLASILKEEPDWTLLPVDTSRKLSDLLHRCLRRDVRNRLHDIGDARIEIEEAIGGDEYGGASSIPSFRKQMVSMSLVAVITAGVTSAVVWSRLRAPAVPGQSLRFVLAGSAVDAIDYGGQSFAISPDGLHLVYLREVNGERRLFHRPLNRIEDEPLSGTEGALDPFFSPDSQWVGFRSGNALRKVSLAGGDPFTVCDSCVPVSTSRAGGATWSALDDTVILSDGAALWRVPASGGTPELLAEPDSEREGALYLRPSVLPSGQAVVFELRQDSDDTTGSIAILRLATGRIDVVADEGTDPEYLSTGHLVYARGGAVFAQPFDVAQLEVTGQPTPVLQGVRSERRGSSYFAVSRSGTLVYLPGGPGVTSKRLVWVDREGRRTPALKELGNDSFPRLSPDATRLVVEDSEGVWVHDLERGGRVRVVDEARFPIWTPDGTRITFVSLPARDLYSKAADGSGAAQLLLESGNIKTSASWSPVGLAFEERNANGNWDIWVKPNQGEPAEFRATPAHEEAPAFSPDGRFLAYVSEESGRPEVYVRRYPPGEGQWTVSTEGGSEPVWSRDGRELFYRHDEGIFAAPVQTTPDFAAGRPARIIDATSVARWRERRASGDLPTPNPNYDVAPDGRFIMVEGEQDPTSGPHIILNWFDELKAKMAEAGQ